MLGIRLWRAGVLGLSALSLLACGGGGKTAQRGTPGHVVPTASSPSPVVAQAQKEWLTELLASAMTGDRSASFPSASRAILMGRLRRAQKLYGFKVVSVKMLHPLQAAPVIVIRSDDRSAIARATPKLIDLVDPRHVTTSNPSGYAYEGYFLVAEDGRGIPYLATFNHWRAPHVGGGQWAAAENLYPFPHG